ncbi:uncharacterized protein [Epargyreus clarus]|uniref:uncharacterized protein n=1 Tax=Epargyreus clarus TaxID=520877 RepID=UPI003C2B2DDB
MGGKKKKSKGNKTKPQSDLASNQDIEEQELDTNESQNTDDLSDSERMPTKRHAEDDDDSDTEVKKKKKKKKQMNPEESTGKKNKKSIRQMKREKHAERQAEAATAAKDQLKSQCITYLSQWKHDRQNWKFMKAKQVWLYKNKFSAHLVPDSSWPVLLEYFESAKGNIRNMLLTDANKIIKQMDDWTESQNKEQPDEETENEIVKPDDKVYSRARSLIQCLEEYTVVLFALFLTTYW